MNLLVKSGVMAVVLSLVGGYIVHRYAELKTEALIGRFIKNARMITAIHDPTLMGNSPDEALQAIKPQSGDLLPVVKARLNPIPPKHFRDPFAPGDTLPLHYGYVKHSSPIQEAHYEPQAPVWFTFSAGPAREAIHFATQPEGDLTAFRFVSPVYAPSNGLRSRGYLFADSRGMTLGR